VDSIFRLMCGIRIRKSEINPEPMEHSLTGDSSHGDPLCSEAPQGATKQNPYSSEASGTPARWEEHLSLYCPSSESLEVLEGEVGTLDPRSRKDSCSGCLPKSGIGRSGSQRLSGTAGRQPQQDPHKSRASA